MDRSYVFPIFVEILLEFSFTDHLHVQFALGKERILVGIRAVLKAGSLKKELPSSIC